MNTYKAILTGDIVGSSALVGVNRKQLDMLLKEALATVFGESSDRKDVFRGDSFQIETNAEGALRKAIQLRTFLKKNTSITTDARIAIGIGAIDHSAKNVKQSDGEAYQLSGKAFDALKKGQCLQINTHWQEYNILFSAIASLSDSIINGYTSNQAEAVYYSLYPNNTQLQIAEILGLKSQSTVSARLKGAHFEAIMAAVDSFEMAINRKLNS